MTRAVWWEGVTGHRDAKNEAQVAQIPDPICVTDGMYGMPTRSELTSEQHSGRILQGTASETLGPLARASTNFQQLHALEGFCVVKFF